MATTSRHPRPLRWVVAACACALSLAVAPLPPRWSAPAEAATTPALTFSANIRATGRDAVFTADADGGDIRQISPNDGSNYNWGRFAFGNTKIVFTVRNGAAGQPESIGIMNLDGTEPRILRTFDYQVLQPLVDKTGRYLTYSAKAPWFPRHAVFQLDLLTNTVKNLTAPGRPKGTFDADPVLTNDGTKVLFVENTPGPGTTANQMNPNGTSREILAPDTFLNTDPTPSNDGRKIAISSYRPYLRSNTNATGPHTEFFYIVMQDRVVHNPSRPAQQVLLNGSATGGPGGAGTGALNCTIREPDDPCDPGEMSAWQPRFTPDDHTVTFVGALDKRTTCICGIDLGNRTGRVIVQSTDLAIHWHEWKQPDGFQTSTAGIGSRARTSALLAVMSAQDKVRKLVIASPDMANRFPVDLGGRLPLEARWVPGRKAILFTANVPVPSPAQPPHPAPPSGSVRVVHKVPAGAQRQSAAVAEPQLFLLNTDDGAITQLTDAWTEDWRDGLARGDKRGNSQPVLAPDGKSVVVRNVSYLSGESFLLRISLETGAVANLTKPMANATASDINPAFSADGRRLVFARTVSSRRGIYTMNAASGIGVRRLRQDSAAASSPLLTPDDVYLFYVSSQSGGSVLYRSAMTGTTRAGTPTTVSGSYKPVSRPVMAPEGDEVRFLAKTSVGTGIYRVGITRTSPAQLQPDLLWTVHGVDWR